MTTLSLLTALITFAFVSSITPGPNNLMLMASGTNFGMRRTLPHLLGVSLGFVAMAFLVGAGLVQVFNAFPASYTLLKIASVAYLLYLAWKVANAAPPATPPQDAPRAQQTSKPMTFFQAVLFQWVNPKAWAMALTALGAFALSEDPLQSALWVALIFGLVNLPCVAIWALLGTQLRRFLTDPRKLKIFNWSAAALLVASLYPIVTTSFV